MFALSWSAGKATAREKGWWTLHQEGTRPPWWHWAGGFGPPLSLSALEKGQMGIWLALGPAGWLGTRGHRLLHRKMGVRASPRGDSSDNFCPLNLPSEGTGRLTPHFDEQSISRGQQEFFLETECREKQQRNEAKQLDIFSNFKGELPTISVAQANSQRSVASSSCGTNSI